MTALIDVRELVKRFGAITAVDGVSFAVERGEVLGFLGPNGAGKSTTMKMVTGFLQPTSGTAVVCGHDVGADPVAVKTQIGYLPEGAPLYGDMTPKSLLAFVSEVRGLDFDRRRRRIGDVVDRLDLGAVYDRPIETLSKGFKRRVGLAQAILHDPDVLILDEPTDGLDPNQKFQVRSLIAEMASTKAIVISTHILEEVDAVCTRAMIIAQGQVLIDTTPDGLRSQSVYHNAVVVDVPAEAADRARQALMAVDGVRHVEVVQVRGETARILIVPSQNRPVIDPVEAAIRANEIPIRGLTVEQGRLDDVFRQITTAPRAAAE